LVAAGAWEPFVDAEPVREHLRKVNAAGMPYMAICERLGLAQSSSLQHLMWGRGEYGPGQQVRRETAELVMSYWPSLDDFPDAARIDATGTRRRVEAMAVRGWPRHMMAEQVGTVESHFRKAAGRSRVTARLARRVAALYDAWWDKDPLEHGVPMRSVSRVRADAARQGFRSALAWDDDTIDDPNAVPLTDAAPAGYTEGDDVAARFLMGESVVLDRAGRREVITHLMQWTHLSTEEIAERLELSTDAVSRTWERIKRKARDEGRKAPWRRVYVPVRDMDLNRNELRSAA
jgi:DNA-binding CsgD family transcriptional regulator